MRKENNKCVYRHRRIDTNEIFYIGMGSEKQTRRVHGRNIFWKNIVNKTKYTIEIIAENLTWEDACELECLLISEYGRRNLNQGFLVNLTNGGDGSKGTSPSKETRIKIGNFHKGNKHSIEHRLKISSSKKGKTMSSDNHKSKKVINVDNSQIFNSIREAADFEKVIYSSFKWRMTYRNNFNYKYYNERNIF